MLNGKVVLITGGSSGIGKAIAMQFGRKGGRIAVVASSNVEKAKEVAEEIVAAGGQATGFAADLRDRAVVRDLVKTVEAQLGPIDILVTSAGIFLPTPIGQADPAVFDQMIDVNVRGTFNCIDAVVPGMKAAGGGRIICLSSAADRLGIAGFSAYCATKGAVTMMVKSLALELAPYEININAISPGNTATPMNEGMRTDPAQRPLLDALNSATPSQRNFSEADDVAELALFLASSAGRAMHGSSLLIDEGLSAGVSL